MTSNFLLITRDLSINVGDTPILIGANLAVREKSIFSIVGGSGSGKTTTGLAILGLLPDALKVKSGEVIFKQENLLKCLPLRMRQIRGKEIGMVFQDTLTAFDPLYTVGYQIEEVLIYHTDLKRKQRKEKVLNLLDTVGIKRPKRIAKSYPHQLSGGMRQRAMIAQAIAAKPKLIIADEPTSNLDVVLQAKIIDLFQKLKEEMNLTVILISHDINMVSHISDDIAVMQNGRVVEAGEKSKILNNAKHPYTWELLEAAKL